MEKKSKIVSASILEFLCCRILKCCRVQNAFNASNVVWCLSVAVYVYGMILGKMRSIYSLCYHYLFLLSSLSLSKI